MFTLDTESGYCGVVLIDGDICGEAPSNYPVLAVWLATAGIDSMSLNPDALLRVAQALEPTSTP